MNDTGEASIAEDNVIKDSHVTSAAHDTPIEVLQTRKLFVAKTEVCA